MFKSTFSRLQKKLALDKQLFKYPTFYFLFFAPTLPPQTIHTLVSCIELTTSHIVFTPLFSFSK